MGMTRAAAWVGILLLIVPAILWAEHIPRMQGYKDASGNSCCGIEDCRPARVFVINQQAGIVEIDGTTLVLAPGSIHPLPLEAHSWSGWVCLRPSECPEQIEIKCVRCLFYRPGDS